MVQYMSSLQYNTNMLLIKFKEAHVYSASLNWENNLKLLSASNFYIPYRIITLKYKHFYILYQAFFGKSSLVLNNYLITLKSK
jgi:hypothetical protein